MASKKFVVLCLYLVFISFVFFSISSIINLAYAQEWWNTTYQYKQDFNVTNNNNTNVLSAGYSVNISVDTATLIANSKLRADCSDLRVVYWNSTDNVELNTDIENACNAPNTTLWFNLNRSIPAGENGTNYSLYYSSPDADNPPKLNLIVNFSTLTMQSFAGSQDTNPSQVEVLDNGRTFHMWGNNWKAFTKSISIQSDTIFDFWFKGNGTEGEIAGISPDTDLSLSANYLFKLYGTQTWGITTYDNFVPPSWKHYMIDVYNFYTGSFNYLVFSNDADAAQATQTYFQHVKIRKYLVGEPTIVKSSETAFDMNAPQINLTLPANNSNTTNTTIVFNFTAVDSAASTMNCSLYTDSVLNQTNSSTLNITPTIFTVENLSQGSHLWYVRCLDDMDNPNVSAIWNFTIDLSAPTVNSVELSPGSSDDIDPNVQINITANMSDRVNISTVIFQYKAYNESDWTNASTNTTDPGIYINASFTPLFNGTWSYRIWANDTLGNSNYSNITNVSVQLDWSWTRSPADMGEASAKVYEVATLGVLTINNTGDYVLGFDLSSNWRTGGGDEKVYYSASEPFTLNPKQGINLDVNATVSDTTRSDDIVITIDALNDSADPTSLEVNATIIAYVSGPYLYAVLYTYDTTYTQGTEFLALNAYVRNLGNETATDVILNWSLPAGFTSEFEFNQSMGNLSVNEMKWSNITVDVSSSASAGSAAISINATCSNGDSANDSKSITIECSDTDGVCGEGCTHLTDADCEQEVVVLPGSSGGGGGGGSFTLDEEEDTAADEVERILLGREIVRSSGSVELVRGESNSFTVDVKNVFEKTELKNVTLKVEGYLSQYIGIDPPIIDLIGYNRTKQFTITVLSPEYMEKGTHDIDIIIVGKIVGEDFEKNLVESRELSLKIHTISGEKTSSLLEQSRADLEELRSKRFHTNKIAKLLEKAEQLHQEHEYDLVKEIIDQIIEMKESGLRAEGLIENIRDKMKSYKSRNKYADKQQAFRQTEELLSLSIAAFQREDYEAAIERAKESELALALASGEFNLVLFLMTYWWALLIILIIIAVLIILLYKYYVKTTISRKIKSLQREESTIQELMRKSQQKHYKDKSMGVSSFKRIMRQYQDRLARIREQRSYLRHKRVRLLKPTKVLDDLEAERKEVTSNIESLQKNYFVKHTIHRSEFEDQSKVFNERLAEIEDEHLTIQTKLSRGKFNNEK